jgi:hypothetical protein
MTCYMRYILDQRDCFLHAIDIGLLGLIRNRKIAARSPGLR